MQGAVDRISKACDNFQLTISTKSQHMESRTANQTLLSMDKNYKLLINSPILEALSPEQCTLMMRLQPELRKQV